MEPILTAVQQGDTASAVGMFLEADWTTRPLFTPGSTLALSEKQYVALTREQQAAASTELPKQSTVLKGLATAVGQAGQAAVAKQEIALARRYFTSLQQYGEALAGPESTALIKLVGQAIKKRGDAELAKLGQ